MRVLPAVLVAAACGGDGKPADLEAQLAAIPGVTVTPTDTTTSGFRYYVLQFTQPVDHADPNGATFQQEVSLLHKDLDAPMIVQTSGYFDYYLDHPVELTQLLGGNQISIEHRFFGTSRPDPADWTKLTIEQMADDEHAIIAALRDIYPGAFVTTGGSKGGMTATYHRRFFPDDVDASVPYVAPMSTGAPDARYTAWVDSIGTADCRTKIRALATEMLQHRRTAMEQHAMAQTGHVYSRIPVGPAVESAIVELEWSFWQYFGIDSCGDIPATTDSDDTLYTFLDRISPVTDNDDVQVGLFEAYYFQAYAQLGYPDNNATYLVPLMMYTDADYNGALPTPVPTYDGGAAMADIAQFIQTQGSKLLFIYGEWDPWTGGKYDLGGATDSLELVQPQGSHNSHLTRLAPADRDLAFDRLQAWTGVAPHAPSSKAVRTGGTVDDWREPRIPPGMRHAKRTGR